MTEQTHVDGRVLVASVLALLLLLPGCRAERAAESSSAAAEGRSEPPAAAPAGAAVDGVPAAAAPFAWPASLRPFGDGYPRAGDACRRMGETAAVADHLDHTRTLVGCPGSADSPEAQGLVTEGNGKVVGEIEGVTLVSLPTQ